MDIDALGTRLAKLERIVEAWPVGAAHAPEGETTPVEDAALELHERVKALEELVEACAPGFDRLASLEAWINEYGPVLERVWAELAEAPQQAADPNAPPTPGG